MFKDYQKRQCLICHEDIGSRSSISHLFYPCSLCLGCIQRLEVIDYHNKFKGYPITVLYGYNEFFKEILYQYKGLDDLLLAKVFLALKPELVNKYRSYQIAVIPSSQADNERRNFCPNEEIVKTFSNKLFTGLYKINSYKQTEQKNRSLVKKVIKLRNGEKLKNQRVLLFDDVITSGNTIKACLELIQEQQPKDIEILVLASNQIKNLF